MRTDGMRTLSKNPECECSHKETFQQKSIVKKWFKLREQLVATGTTSRIVLSIDALNAHQVQVLASKRSQYQYSLENQKKIAWY